MFRAIASLLYNIALRLRHFMFDAKIFGRERFDIPVVCVGNITVGGTGKTPMIEFLIHHLGAKHTVAVLSRGYGRKTKGYREVTGSESFRSVGDEPRQIKLKFPSAVVVVCENRREGIRRIQAEHPEVNMILMDDGFQHRRVEPALNIVLVDYTRPVWEDHLLPWGHRRDLKSQMSRACIVVFTKIPAAITQIEKRIAEKNLRLYPYQSLYFTSMQQDTPYPLFPDVPSLRPLKKEIAVMAAVGNPTPLLISLSSRYDVLEQFIFPDHHAYRVSELRSVEEKMRSLPEDTVIVITEKDAVKLSNREKIPEQLQARLYVVPVRIAFHEEGGGEKFIRNIVYDIKSEYERRKD